MRVAGRCAGRHKKWHFTPKNFREGQHISGGSIFGEVYENELMPVHAIMCPPKVYGTVTKVYGAGTDGHEEFDLTDPVCARAAWTWAWCWRFVAHGEGGCGMHVRCGSGVGG